MEISVIVIEPRYQINLGYIARTCKNFSVRRLALVDPKCKKGRSARMYAKHGIDILESARSYGSMEGAARGAFTIGSTAVWRKGKRSLYNIFSIEEMASMLRANGIDRVSLVLGREASGLTSDELRRCSSIAYVPMRGAYATMNISHALAVMLYELTRKRRANPRAARPDEMRNLEALFKKSLRGREDIRSKRTVGMAMSHVLERSNPTREEIAALSAAFTAKRGKGRQAGRLP